MMLVVLEGITFVALMAPQFFLVTLMVYFVNGTSDFRYWQCSLPGWFQDFNF